MNLIAPSLYQSALLGYAGISCQLHPLKAKDLMMYRVIQIKRKKDMHGYVYQLKALKVVNKTSPISLQSAVYQGCAGRDCQLHPLEVKRNKDERMLLDFFIRACDTLKHFKLFVSC